MTYRVIQWGAGNTGTYSLRSVLAHPELELVGLKVFSPSKTGSDAGVLAGGGTIGIAATDSRDEVLVLDADCVLYMGADHTLADPGAPDSPNAPLLDDMCRLLASGKNMIATAVCSLTWPGAQQTAVRQQLGEACARGNSSFVAIGIDPGFMGDFLPVALTSLCTRVDRITSQEILNYAAYDAPASLRKYGFGFHPGECNFDNLAGPLGYSFGVAVLAVADRLGLELEDTRIRFDTAVTDKGFDIPAFHVEPGQVAAVRFAIDGLVNGEPVITLEHITRIHNDAAPDWPILTGGRYGYRVLIEGSPSLQTEIALGEPGGDNCQEACHATAARAVNAVPLICAAPAGVYSQFDLRLITGRGRMG